MMCGEKYVKGQLKMELLKDENGTRFRLEGNFLKSPDHCQLLYEALELAANSDDLFKSHFEAMLEETIELTAKWEEGSSCIVEASEENEDDEDRSYQRGID